MPVDLHRVAVEGAEVVYAAAGAETAPPIVFVHGWVSSHKFWRETIPAFAPRYRCVAPDLVGFGLSGKPRRDYSIEAYARWLEGFLDALGLGRVVLVGHSMGGTIALLFALERPARVGRLALVNPVVRGPGAFSLRSRLLTVPVLRSLLFALAHVRFARRWVARGVSVASRFGEDLVDDLVGGTYASTLDSLRSLKRIDLVPRLGALSVPTLAVGTDGDRVVDPRQYELVPAARRVLIPQTGHIPMLERPGEFNGILNAFLGRGV